MSFASVSYKKWNTLSSVAEPQAQGSVQDFYEQNKDNYNIQPTVTFTRVFINRENHESSNAAKQAACRQLEEMAH